MTIQTVTKPGGVSHRSPEETNLVRLLNQCEIMAGGSANQDWRLEKYVGALHEQLAELKRKQTNPPRQEVVNEYRRRIDFLAGIINTSKLKTLEEKAAATQLLAPGHITQTGDRHLATRSAEIHLQTKARFATDLKRELLGDSREDTLRWRSPSNQDSSDLDVVIQQQKNLHEKLADEMLIFTKSLKDTTMMANRIINEDNKTLADSSKMADSNYEKLRVETERLDTTNKQGCSWGLWGMMFVVSLLFLWMIIFIRLFPK